jgi:hypothetical protein
MEESQEKDVRGIYAEVARVGYENFLAELAERNPALEKVLARRSRRVRIIPVLQLVAHTPTQELCRNNYKTICESVRAALGAPCHFEIYDPDKAEGTWFEMEVSDLE